MMTADRNRWSYSRHYRIFKSPFVSCASSRALARTSARAGRHAASFCGRPVQKVRKPLTFRPCKHTSLRALIIPTMQLPPIYYQLRTRWMALSPRARMMSICGVVAAAGLCIYGAFHGDPVERAVARGDLHAAKTELRKSQVADSGARSYDAGRIAEAQKSYGVAVASYLTASRQGDERGLQRLIEMTR